MIRILSTSWLTWTRWRQITTFWQPWSSLKWGLTSGKMKIHWKVAGLWEGNWVWRGRQAVLTVLSPGRTRGRNYPSRIMSKQFCPEKVQIFQNRKLKDKSNNIRKRKRGNCLFFYCYINQISTDFSKYNIKWTNDIMIRYSTVYYNIRTRPPLTL